MSADNSSKFVCIEEKNNSGFESCITDKKLFICEYILFDLIHLFASC